MSEPETIEAEVVAEMGHALEVAQPTPPTLFRTDDPAEVIRRATAVAETLKDVLVKQGLVSKIKDREHVRVEGWTLCGTMLGVFPVCTWTRTVTDNTLAVIGWEARVEARTLAGAVVGAAEAMCLRSESTWKSRDDYALRSMAQTRATSKAMRQPLGFIVQLAGFDPTPAEEMPTGERRKEGGLEPTPTPKSWAAINRWYEHNGGPGAWALAESFHKAAMMHLFGKNVTKDLNATEKGVYRDKAAEVVVWLGDHPNAEQTLGGYFPKPELYAEAWATVLDGTMLEIPDSGIPFGEETP